MKQCLIRYGWITILVLVLVASISPFAGTSTSYASGTQFALRLINERSLKALSVSGWDKQAEGALIQQFPNVEGDYQKWYLEYLGNGYYHIRNVGSGYLLDVSGVSSYDGANVIQWPDNNGWNQQWEIIGTGENDPVKIKNRGSGKLLDMSGQSTSDGGQAIQWYDNGGHNQHWYLLS
ncbi:RICIN domain-containing protein [Paenibacillus sp. P36]|uniref:RICIN domain-containing protein n=1 Tax=Paenibacillus sp. P36 TaxID=3342538 RepID=UPI0038B2A277